MNTIGNTLLNRIKSKMEQDRMDMNIGVSERALSVFSGGLMVGMSLKSLFKHPIKSCFGLAIGGVLVYRGVTGHSDMKKVVDKMTEDEVTVIEHRYFVR
ncbi:DUF2892 domain-containing protein [Sphingobacterium sp. SGG-5]|uniref:YgaP family membrane protein n=1 Tax=Sphingobacterium sp. SGG-5 TaxID=2710881 RepID=UPI0013EB3CC9|nr:DUF2892 domain-containing protein [Sphingobacterium sp. SGG-5]NGM61913.1 DUF2892 domain-containing protein [Sphingobacterium sp. SGG-5]